MRRLALCLSCVLVWAALRVSGAQSGPTANRQDSPFMLGLLYDNGVLQPLFHFAAGSWTTPWPTEGGVPVQPPRLELPASIGLVPPTWWPGLESSTWSVVLPDGRRSLRLVKPTSIYAGCGDLAPAIQTDFPGGRRPADSATVVRVGPAVAGHVIVRLATTVDAHGPPGPVWRQGVARLWSAARRHDRTTEGLTPQSVSRIPAQGGGVIWSAVALSSGRVVTLWESTGGSPFEHFVDRATEPDHELSGVITPIASLWGLGRLTLLVREQGFDGGQFAIVALTSEGARTLAVAGGGSC